MCLIILNAGIDLDRRKKCFTGTKLLEISTFFLLHYIDCECKKTSPVIKLGHICQGISGFDYWWYAVNIVYSSSGLESDKGLGHTQTTGKTATYLLTKIKIL